MRVTVDTDLCQGHAMCELEAPEVFRYEKKADHVTILQEHPPEQLRPQVQAAVRYCPTMALEIVEDD